MFRKMICVLLAATLCVSMSAYAAPPRSTAVNYDDLHWETVYVPLEDGNVIAVEVAQAESHSNSVPTRSLTPEYEIGEIKNTYVRISNDQLMAVGIVGSTVGNAAKTKLLELAASALSIKLAIIVVTASLLAEFIGAANLLWGEEGFIVETTHEYFAHYMSKEGHYIYGWDLIDASVYWY